MSFNAKPQSFGTGSDPVSAALKPAAGRKRGLEVVDWEYAGRKFRCCLEARPRNRHVRLRVLPPPAEGHLIGPGANAHRESGQPPLLPGLPPAWDCTVHISHPPRFSRARVFDILRQHQVWIARQTERLHAQRPELARRALVTGAVLPYRGHELTLLVFQTPHRNAGVRTEAANLICHVRRTDQQSVRRSLESWYREQTQILLEESLRRLAPGHPLQPACVRIAAQKSRWGSCSQRGTLSFNWKLAMVPDEVRDYVVVHELAHLEEMNHSERFWRLVESRGAQVRRAQAWLREHGPELDW
jgi:predicted metal-dependent hydrolase